MILHLVPSSCHTYHDIKKKCQGAEESMLKHDITGSTCPSLRWGLELLQNFTQHKPLPSSWPCAACFVIHQNLSMRQTVSFVIPTEPRLRLPMHSCYPSYLVSQTRAPPREIPLLVSGQVSKTRSQRAEPDMTFARVSGYGQRAPARKGERG